jgi:hypothetical protein
MLPFFSGLSKWGLFLLIFIGRLFSSLFSVIYNYMPPRPNIPKSTQL